MLKQADTDWTMEEAAHLLNRAGFGGSPEEIGRWHEMGRHAAVEKLLSGAEPAPGPRMPEWATPEQALAERMERREAMKAFEQENKEMPSAGREEARREAMKKFQQESRRRTAEAQGWWFRGMMNSAAPLREKMTLFWHDHFATSIQKVREPYLMLAQNQLFREHALGNFKTLTAAVAKDPAMLIYLDLRDSRKDRPNENFARELLELFTLGEGNYSETDIREAARAFTGYRPDPRSMKVVHNRKQWDDGNKTIFGATGPFDGGDVIDLAFQQPAAAPFISRKLWEFFVAENPPDSTVEALANSLRASGYETAPALRKVFLSREFYSPEVMRTQIKCPVQFLIGMLKQLEINDPPAGFPIAAQQQLGQVLFLPPNVAGWDWGKAWINTNTLLARYNLAGVLTKGADDKGRGMERMADRDLPGARRMARQWPGPDYEKIAPPALRREPEQLVDTLIFRFFQGPVPGKARESFMEYANAKREGSFTDKEVAELCHLMLSTPYYQLC